MERELRRYERIANTNHFCDHGCNNINPGEMYEGRVVVSNKRLIVWKTHINPSCDFPEDPKDEKRLENRAVYSEELRLAA